MYSADQCYLTRAFTGWEHLRRAAGTGAPAARSTVGAPNKQRCRASVATGLFGARIIIIVRSDRWEWRVLIVLDHDHRERRRHERFITAKTAITRTRGTIITKHHSIGQLDPGPDPAFQTLATRLCTSAPVRASGRPRDWPLPVVSYRRMINTPRPSCAAAAAH